MKPRLPFIFITIQILLMYLSSAQALTNQFISVYDSVQRVALPELKLPDQFRNLPLPPVIDNSTQPYWRPIFNQTGASCGQAAGVAYNFTYEMCRRLNRDASLPENQFPSHFVYNFMNYFGYYGVNYYHSFEVLRTLGTPTLADYGGMAIDNGNKWISGYDFYRNAMRNRIKAVHRIKTNDVEGLLILKHWLAHHLDGSAVGGVANFNAAGPWGMQPLPQGTPEAGKLAMIQFQGNQATHAMTIVGYNDSIRWDYNGDGQYTNHLDINGDGVVNLLDYEIGAFKVGNSYGDTWGNQGYFYMMYRLMAQDVYYGGIWNQQVEVLELNEPYEPLLTMKLTVKHNMREQIRINAGISSDTSELTPEHRLMFPVFNFQGGPQFMQGGTSDPMNQFIEIGLDLTPLLSFINSGQPARFFLEVLENDSLGNGDGAIVYYALRDYTTPQPSEIACPNVDVPIAHNTITRLSILHDPVFDDVQITTPYIPLFDAGHQLVASGGTSPYKWALKHEYHQQFVNQSFPQAQQLQLQLEGPNYRYVRKTIGFEFPFYGKKYTELFMHRDGFLLFGPELFPWPYYKDTYLLFRTMQNISAFLVSPIQYYPGTKGADGMWYEGDANHATFLWKKPIMYYDKQIGFGEFAVTLYPDGKIDFHYGDLNLTEPVLWYAGVSAGEQTEFQLIKGSGSRTVPQNRSFGLLYDPPAEGISITTDGFLYGIALPSDRIHNLMIEAEDDKGLKDQRGFQLSDRVLFDLVARTADGNNPLAGDTVVFDLLLRDLWPSVGDQLNITLSSNDPQLQLIQYALSIQIPEGGLVTVPAAFKAFLSPATPNSHYIPLTLTLQGSFGNRHGQSGFVAYNAELIKLRHLVDDNGNRRIDPGETAPFRLTLANVGRAAANQLQCRLVVDNPFLSVSPGQVFLPVIHQGGESVVTFSLSASQNSPVGYKPTLRFVVTSGADTLLTSPIRLKIGQYPLLLYLKSSSSLSYNTIRSTLDQLGVPYVQATALPDSIADFRAVMICLGGVNSSGSLNDAQSAKLVDYLDNGGQLYMEGATVWAFNRPPMLYDKFSINGSYLSPAVYAETITGVQGTFTQSLSFPYANPLYQYVFFAVPPVGSAFPLLQNVANEPIILMTANDKVFYKTIASSIEFGHLGQSDAHEPRRQLMSGILQFFDLGYLVTSLQDVKTKNRKKLLLTPNPVFSTLTIALPEIDILDAQIRVYSATGKLLIEQSIGLGNARERISLDVGSLKPGLYFVTVQTNDGSLSSGFLKQ